MPLLRSLRKCVSLYHSFLLRNKGKFFIGLETSKQKQSTTPQDWPREIHSFSSGDPNGERPEHPLSKSSKNLALKATPSRMSAHTQADSSSSPCVILVNPGHLVAPCGKCILCVIHWKQKDMSWDERWSCRGNKANEKKLIVLNLLYSLFILENNEKKNKSIILCKRSVRAGKYSI